MGVVKIVYELKKKHRNDIWEDRDGYIWFWSSLYNDWAYLNDVAEVGYTPRQVEEMPGWPDAPFKRISKGPRE